MEMMVVVSIFLIITAVVLFNAPRFRQQASIDLIANEVAVLINEAKTYGIGALVETVEDPAPVYAVVFDNTSVNNTKIKIYSFENESEIDLTSLSGSLVTYNLDGGVSVNNLTYNSNNQGAGDNLAVIFKRDGYGQAQFKCADTCSSVSYVSIELVNNEGDKKTIEVWNNGQIAVK